MVEKLRRLVVEEEGQGMVEYSLITALIAIIAIAIFGGGAANPIRVAITTLFADIATAIDITP